MITDSSIWRILGLAALFLVAFWGLILLRAIILKRPQPPASERFIAYLQRHRAMLTTLKFDVDFYLTMVEQKGALVAVTKFTERAESEHSFFPDWKDIYHMKDELEKKG